MTTDYYQDKKVSYSHSLVSLTILRAATKALLVAKYIFKMLSALKQKVLQSDANMMQMNLTSASKKYFETWLEN